ncbi:MAG: hypothetical protein JXA99_03305 [Candidatus Lokiarchaeota archaeon]|nr:hypothetical protein [Candidatus Lokiarchaeota archaeon]
MNWIILIISGLAYFIHILIDTFDWGTNFFYFYHKNLGFRLLYLKEEIEKIDIEYKIHKAYFDLKYYNNKIILSLEISIFILMVLILVIIAPKYIYAVIFYFLILSLHLLRYFQLKEDNKEN